MSNPWLNNGNTINSPVVGGNGGPTMTNFWGPNGGQQNQPSVPSNFLPHYDVIQVSGENGARAFQMGPNSSVLLADKEAAIVWLVCTDGAGYKTIMPYDITPHRAAPPVDLNNLETRLAQVEEWINAKQSAFGSAKQSKKSNANANTSANAKIVANESVDATT